MRLHKLKVCINKKIHKNAFPMHKLSLGFNEGVSRKFLHRTKKGVPRGSRGVLRGYFSWFEEPFKGYLSRFVSVLMELRGIQGHFNRMKGFSETFQGF